MAAKLQALESQSFERSNPKTGLVEQIPALVSLDEGDLGYMQSCQGQSMVKSEINYSGCGNGRGDSSGLVPRPHPLALRWGLGTRLLEVQH